MRTPVFPRVWESDKGILVLQYQTNSPFPETWLPPPFPKVLLVYSATDLWTHMVLKALAEPCTAHSNPNTFSPDCNWTLFLSFPRTLTSTDKSRHDLLHTHLFRSSLRMPNPSREVCGKIIQQDNDCSGTSLLPTSQGKCWRDRGTTGRTPSHRPVGSRTSAYGRWMFPFANSQKTHKEGSQLMPNKCPAKKEREHIGTHACMHDPRCPGLPGQFRACRPQPLPELGERAQGEGVFMTLLINSLPAVKNPAQTDNKNKYLIVSQLCWLKMDFTLKDTADPGEGFNGIFEF